jgi:hypothetical protein
MKKQNEGDICRKGIKKESGEKLRDGKRMQGRGGRRCRHGRDGGSKMGVR